MRLIFFGSGAFGLPTLEQLIRRHDVTLVVTQPDRPAGRKRTLTATPVGAYATDHALATIKPADVNAPEAVERIRSIEADAFVVIAFGQKMGRPLLGDTFAINLHASLLPKFRGAAPINWAMIHGETHTGVSVITLADRMDAGDVLAQSATAIDPGETAGELHDRLATTGPVSVLKTLERFEAGTLEPRVQDESLVTQAPKLAKADGIVDFEVSSARVRSRIHGLTPWPGCTVGLDGHDLKVLRVRALDEPAAADVPPGTILDDLSVACASGRVELLSVRPPGGKTMAFRAYCNGHNVKPGQRIDS